MSEKPKCKKSQVSQSIIRYVQESKEAKKTRMDMNEANFNCYHLKQDYSHKLEGQSKEFLPKQATAVEQITEFLQQGLVDHGKWFSIEAESGVTYSPEEEMNMITPSDMEKLLGRHLKKNKFENYVADALKMAFLGSLMIMKSGGITKSVVTGVSVVPSDDEDDESEPVPELTRKDYWQLDLDLVRQEDFFPDPSGSNLYEVERIEIDKFKLIELAEARPDIYNLANVKMIGAGQEEDQRSKKSSETGQDVTISGYRNKVTIYEAWGTFLGPNGEVLYKNHHAACSQEGIEIIAPRKNPNWHGESPYTVGTVIRVPKSVWHKALMDAPTKLNTAMNELFNLMFDSGMMSVHGIKQYRPDWLDDPSQVANGIAAGDSLGVNSMCPPGSKVMERVDTGGMTQEGLSLFNLTSGEFNESALTNSLRLGGQSERAVKATEIVASNQAINSVMTGMIKLIEEDCIAPHLKKNWYTIAQNMNDMGSEELKALLGPRKAAVIAKMSRAEIFAQTAVGMKFNVFGLSTTVNKINDFRKLTALLQTISGSELLAAEFRKKYSFSKFLGELVKSLDINTDKIKADQQEIAQGEAERQAQLQAQSQQGQGKGQGEKDLQSQIPQDNGGPETGLDVDRSSLLQGMTNPGGN